MGTANRHGNSLNIHTRVFTCVFTCVFVWLSTSRQQVHASTTAHTGNDTAFSISVQRGRTEDGLYDTISWDTNKYYMRYNTHTPDLDTWICDDFTKNATIYKIRNKKQASCYIGMLTRDNTSAFRTNIILIQRLEKPKSVRLATVAAHFSVVLAAVNEQALVRFQESSQSSMHEDNLLSSNRSICEHAMLLCNQLPTYRLSEEQESEVNQLETNYTSVSRKSRTKRFVSCAPRTYWYTFLDGYCWMFCGCDIRWSKRENPAEDNISIHVFSGERCTWPGTICPIVKWSFVTARSFCSPRLVELFVFEQCN